MFGIPVEHLEMLGRDLAGNAPEAFEVWPELVESLRCFLACRTQWRMGAGYQKPFFIGLDYTGVRITLQALRVRDWRSVFADIQVMEGAALGVFNAA